MKCEICGRQLDQHGAPLSIDCGGDCWGCIGEIEADMGNPDSMKKVREEFARGLRPNWIDPATSG
jgi:ferredoxin